MKTFTRSVLLLFILLESSLVHSQTTVYADTLIDVSNEWDSSNASCSNAWAACQILGAPDVYPICADNGGAWAFPCIHVREWIEVGYSTALYVDTVRIYETNHSGEIDTIYLRDAQTGIWNMIYDTTALLLSGCNVLDVIIPTTSYKVDAVRLAIGDYPGNCFPEYDAVALIGSTGLTTVIDENKIKNVTIFPNPSRNGKFQVQSLILKIQNLEVYNIMGEKVLLQQNINEIDLSNFQKGIYFTKIYAGAQIHIEKIVIE